MGILARRLADYEEVRNDAGWLTRQDGVDGDTPTVAGQRVTRNTALGLTTVWRCADLLSSAVAHAPKDIILKIGGKSFPEFTKPGWLLNPNPLDPTYTSSDYFAQVALSLIFDGNYFVSVYPHVLDPQVLTVLDPARVDIRPGPVYDIKDGAGKIMRTVGPMEMLHGPWIRLPGTLRGIAPLEVLRRSMGAAIAAEDHAARFFSQGTALSFGVEVPGPMTNEKREELRDSLRKKYGGNGNAHTIGVLTAGSKFIGGLAPTPEQAQMLATRQFSVEELARPFGVPPHMVGSQQPGAVSYASVNGTLLEFKQYAVLPMALRIEAQHNRLATVPGNVGDPNATAQFRFNLDGIARADLQTRIQSYKDAVLVGVYTPDEARGYEDLAPMPGGDRLYMQQQMVPLTDLGQTKATEPLNTQPAPAGANA